MNPEQTEHHILEIIRAECKRHGHGVSFELGDGSGETLHMTTTYDLNRRARMHAAVAYFMSCVGIGAGAGAIVGEVMQANVPCEGPLVIFALNACYVLNAAVRVVHHDTIDGWCDYMHQILWEQGYEISKRDGVTVIGYRA